MMQGFYLLAMQQARRRTLLAALACLAAMISLVLAGRALLSAPAVPASAAISYTVQSENDRLVIRQSDGSVLRTGIDTRTLPSAEQQALADGITLDNAEELARLLEAGDLPSACRRLMVCACEDVGLACMPQAEKVFMRVLRG